MYPVLQGPLKGGKKIIVSTLHNSHLCFTGMYYLHNTYYIAQIHYLLLFLITIITKISKKAHEILKNNCDF